jgi:omega-6 fatty acid desaturase (delta-12 desaturase)
VYSHISKYAMADDWRASWEIIKTVLMLILTLYMEKSNSIIIYVLGCLLRGLIYLRVFSMFHDFAHNSFYSRQAYNDICAYGQTMLFGMPYNVWTKKHNFHHKFSNNLNYVQDNQTAPLTLTDYLNLPPHL